MSEQTCWRIKPGSMLSLSVNDLAKREGRSTSNMLKVLVGEAAMARGRIPSSVSDKFDDMTERRSTLVLRNLAPEFRGAIRTIARAAHRSVTAMSKILLAEALAARGLETGAPRTRVDAQPHHRPNPEPAAGRYRHKICRRIRAAKGTASRSRVQSGDFPECCCLWTCTGSLARCIFQTNQQEEEKTPLEINQRRETKHININILGVFVYPNTIVISIVARPLQQVGAP
jgi:hypothetical protein